MDIFNKRESVEVPEIFKKASAATNIMKSPHKQMIIQKLQNIEYMTVTEVYIALRTTQPNASRHLAELKKIGVVTFESFGREKRYRLDRDGLAKVTELCEAFSNLGQ